jgi:hypothetical protein
VLPLGFRFDVDAVIIDGTAHGGLPTASTGAPGERDPADAGDTYWARCCPRDCGCAPLFETLLSYTREPAARLSV